MNNKIQPARQQKQTTDRRLPSIDFVRGVVMAIMALDHVRMYFAAGTWYSSPTDLATTTPLLFFTRWITHFCAPVFVFLAGTSAFLYGQKKGSAGHTALFLFTRGLWLVFVEIAIVSFGWTFDVTYSFVILQVIWAIGLSMIALAGLVLLPMPVIIVAGMLLVFGHNLLDPITVQGSGFADYLWYVLHQPRLVIEPERIVSIFYPVLPWLGVMALGYAAGPLFKAETPAGKRTLWLLGSGIAATSLFLLLRLSNGYGEPTTWLPLDTGTFTWISFLNTTKYPPSLQFLLMTLGPALVLLALAEAARIRAANPFVVFGRVPFFFYILHIYIIHALALFVLDFTGWEWREYILTAENFLSGRLEAFGFGLGAVYAVWAAVVLALYPLCRGYQKVRESHPEWWWLGYL
ncbi:MAG TPA: heparan-alpha-glucosaminide N-acetyltransferase domain-containing protein [Anaerolineales bacterium]|nr:heparan-alpha-glucosaminide N-acetyltransferase domain-containing protein [Anaerolineales bacterium]